MEFRERQHLGNVFFLTRERLACQLKVEDEDLVVRLLPERSRPKKSGLLLAALALGGGLLLGPGLSQAQEPAEEGEAAGPVLTRAPELLFDATPDYPRAALEAGLEGSATVRLLLDESGTVEDVVLVETTDPVFEEAALAAGWALVFSPAEIDGAPAAIEIDYTFQFELEEPAEPDVPPPGLIEGEVRDLLEGTPLAFASLLVEGLRVEGEAVEVMSDEQGRFALEGIPPGQWMVAVYLDGYEQLRQEVELAAGERLSVAIALTPSEQPAHTTVVRTTRPWREVERAPLTVNQSSVTSSYQLTRRDLQLSMGGLGDMMRATHALPGVVADTGVLATIYVRGGDTGETAFSLDGWRIRNPMHLGGLLSIYDSEITEQVRFYAGAAPAEERSGLSAAMAVGYQDGPHGEDRVDGAIDVNLFQVAGNLGLALGPERRTRIQLGVRHSWFDSYVKLLDLLGVPGITSEQPFRYGDYFLRLSHTFRDGQRLRWSGIYSHDRLELFDLRLFNQMAGGAFDWLLPIGERGQLLTALHYTWTREDQAQLGSLEQAEVREHRATLRSDLDLHYHPRHTLGAGVEAAAVVLAGDGEVADRRTIPTWAAIPWAETGTPNVPVQAQAVLPELDVYVEDVFRPLGPEQVEFHAPPYTRDEIRLELRGGARMELRGTGSGAPRVTLSPRLGFSLTLPSATTVKGAFGLYHQQRNDLQLLDPAVGNPELRPERSLQLVIGLEQLLPFGMLLRLEGYWKRLDQLVVHPDDPSRAGEVGNFTNDGFGEVAGMDLLFGFRQGRVGLGGTFSLLQTTRTNPLNTLHPEEVAPAWDQRVGLALGGNVKLGREQNILIALNYLFRTGRPASTLHPESYRNDEGEERWVWLLDGLNDTRRGDFHALNVRFEHTLDLKRLRMRFYIEVLAELAGLQFLEVCGAEGDITGAPPTCEPFAFLPPVRPWVGLVLDW